MSCNQGSHFATSSGQQFSLGREKGDAEEEKKKKYKTLSKICVAISLSLLLFGSKWAIKRPPRLEHRMDEKHFSRSRPDIEAFVERNRSNEHFSSGVKAGPGICFPIFGRRLFLSRSFFNTFCSINDGRTHAQWMSLTFFLWCQSFSSSCPDRWGQIRFSFGDAEKKTVLCRINQPNNNNIGCSTGLWTLSPP